MFRLLRFRPRAARPIRRAGRSSSRGVICCCGYRVNGFTVSGAEAEGLRVGGSVRFAVCEFFVLGLGDRERRDRGGEGVVEGGTGRGRGE